jgi:hypothetical protein
MFQWHDRVCYAKELRRHKGLLSYQWLYITEEIPTIVLGLEIMCSGLVMNKLIHESTQLVGKSTGLLLT